MDVVQKGMDQVGLILFMDNATRCHVVVKERIDKKDNK